MTTGSILLPIIGATLPDGSTNNAAARLQRVQGSASAPSPAFVQLLFDAAADQMANWTFRVPVNYASSPVAKLLWKANTTSSNTVRWGVRIAAITPADADTPNEHAFATSNEANGTPNGTEARRLVETSITLTNADSLAAGDLVTMQVFRNADDAGNDTCTVDAELVALTIEYTTT